MSTMQCDVVSVQESLYSGAVTMLIAKGAGGELGYYAWSRATSNFTQAGYNPCSA